MESIFPMRAIGRIQSPFKQKFGTPRQNGLVREALGVIQLDSEHCPHGCLQDLKGFSHIWLIFGFHQNPPGNTNGKIHPPRLNGDKVGLFATRSPHRPNNIGLSLVKLEKVDEGALNLHVSGIDLIDETPIFDIKPYIPEYDFALHPQLGWLEKADEPIFQVVWQANESGLNPYQVNLINETLSRDLRNREDKEKNLNGPFKSYIDNFDVWFLYQGDKVLVQEIRFNR